MRVEEHNPPSYVDIPDDEVGIFLAGPIQGAPDWQNEAVQKLREIVGTKPSVEQQYLRRKYRVFGKYIVAASSDLTQSDRTLHIFNPRRPDKPDDDFDYEEQVNWELDMLERARDRGAILFWFAKQNMSLDYPQGRAYAQTSRFELGMTVGWRHVLGSACVRLSVGIEPGYQGGSEKYIRHLVRDVNEVTDDSLDRLCVDGIAKTWMLVRG